MLELGLLLFINFFLLELLILIYVDGLFFEWVLINLLENVVKYVGV